MHLIRLRILRIYDIWWSMSVGLGVKWPLMPPAGWEHVGRVFSLDRWEKTHLICQCLPVFPPKKNAAKCFVPTVWRLILLRHHHQPLVKLNYPTLEEYQKNKTQLPQKKKKKLRAEAKFNHSHWHLWNRSYTEAFLGEAIVSGSFTSK